MKINTVLVLLVSFLLEGSTSNIAPWCKSVDRISITFEEQAQIRQDKKEYLEQVEAKYQGKAIPQNINNNFLIKTDHSILFFRSKIGDSIVALDPCCDGAQVAYIFHKINVPDKLIIFYSAITQNNEIGVSEGAVIGLSPKEFIAKKIEYAVQWDAKRFVTQNGCKLGMTSKEAIKLYGQPESIKVVDKKKQIKRYSWVVYGQYDGYDGGFGPPKMQGHPKFCETLDMGADYIIDFQKVGKTDKAIFIYIEHHVP